MKNVISDVNKVTCKIRKPVFKIFKKGLNVTNDYVVFNDPNGFTEKYINSWKDDFTALEARENSFHVDQKLDMNINNIEQRMNYGVTHGLFQKSIYACEGVFNLFKNTKKIKENDNFVLIFSISSYIDEFDFDRDDMDTISSSIRFTKTRPNQSWLVENLEEYAQPIITIEFNQESLENIPLNWWT